jgi:hypothetical protein
MPILQAVAGNAFPRCKQVRLPVGDQNGNIRSSEGDVWVTPEGLEYEESRPYQTRWILDSYVDQATYKADGNGVSKEGFISDSHHSWNPLLATGLAVGLALTVAYTIAKH